MMKRIAILIIDIYQKTVSLEHGLLGKIVPYRVCRFYPSCSQYAKEAISRFGVLRGARMSAARLARCHPWHLGGIDPVPKKESGKREE
jgi:putative membrane protein insertion efficiency factor